MGFRHHTFALIARYTSTHGQAFLDFDSEDFDGDDLMDKLYETTPATITNNAIAWVHVVFDIKLEHTQTVCNFTFGGPGDVHRTLENSFVGRQ